MGGMDDNGGSPPEMPDASERPELPSDAQSGGTPPEKPDGEQPDMGQNGGTPPERSDGDEQINAGGFESGAAETSLVNYPIDDTVLGTAKEDRPMLAWIIPCRAGKTQHSRKKRQPRPASGAVARRQQLQIRKRRS